MAKLDLAGKRSRAKTIVWYPPVGSTRAMATVSGLGFLEQVRDGSLPPPPAAMLLGYQLHHVSPGCVSFRLKPEECHYNPFASVHGGFLATLLDTAMTAAIWSTLPEGLVCRTVEIKVNFVRRVSARSGLLSCEASPVHIGSHLASAEGRLEDEAGRLCAHGICTCAIIEAGKAESG